MRFGSVLVIAAVAGAAAASYVYYKNYKKVHEDLEDDFKEFEDDRDDFVKDDAVEVKSAPHVSDDPNFKYTSLSSSKEDFVDAAKNTFEAAKGMIPPAKNIAKDVADIMQEKACDANVIVGDYYTVAKDKAKVVAGDYYTVAKDKAKVVANEAKIVANEAKVVAKEATAVAKDKLGIVEEDALGKDTVDDIIIDIDVAGNIREEE